MTTRTSRIAFVYAAFLASMGVIAFAVSGFDPKAKTALMSGGMSAVIVAGLTYAALRGPVALRPAFGWAVPAVALLLAGVFTWRTTMALLEHGTPAWKTYKPIVIGTMQVTSLFVAGLLVGRRSAGV